MFTEDILAANLVALEQAQGRRPDVAALDRSSLRVVGTPAGPDLEILTRSGQWTAFEGIPDGELQRAPSPSSPRQLFLIGTGLGQTLDGLDRVGGPTRVVVLEPDPGVAALLLARRDWRRAIHDKRLRVLVGPRYEGASSCARDADVSETPRILVAPALSMHRPDQARLAEAVARRIINEAQANADARRRFAGRYLLQTLNNLDAIGREADAAALDGRFAGRPAVLAAAGPSLDNTIESLERLQNRALIVAADTALRPLLGGGVRPHLVVGVDPAEVNAAHLSGAGGADATYLAAEGSLHPSAFPSFAGRTFVFRVSRHDPWPWLETLGFTRGVVRAWGSVLTSAFDLALRMGCDPIVFTGADLAYTNGRPYCRGTIFESLWSDWHQRGSTWADIWTLLTHPPGVSTVDDISGRPVRTAPHLLAFRNWLADQMEATPGRRFINATGGGVLMGPNVVQATLDEALSGPPLGDTVSTGLQAAHASSPRSDLLRAAGVLASSLSSGGSGDLLARWTEFAAGSVSRDDILAALG